MSRGRRRDPSYKDSDYEVDMAYERRRAQIMSPCSEGRPRVAQKKRPGRSSADGTSEEEDRRRRRLLANRRSAQRSRVKRLEEVGVLEGLVDELMKEVDELRSELTVWNTRHKELLAVEQMLSAQLQGAAPSPADASGSVALGLSPAATAAAAAMSMDAAGAPPWDLTSLTGPADRSPDGSGPQSGQHSPIAGPLLPAPGNAEQLVLQPQVTAFTDHYTPNMQHRQHEQHSSPRRGFTPPGPAGGDAMVSNAGTGTGSPQPEADTRTPTAGDSGPVAPHIDLASDPQGYTGAPGSSPSRSGCIQSRDMGRNRGQVRRRDAALICQSVERELADRSTPNPLVVYQLHLPYTAVSRPTSPLSLVIAKGYEGPVANGATASTLASAVTALGQPPSAARMEPPGLCRRESDLLPLQSDPAAALLASLPGCMSPSHQSNRNTNINVPVFRAAIRLVGGAPCVSACELEVVSGVCMSHVNGALSATVTADPSYTDLAASSLGDGACLVAATSNGRGGREDGYAVSPSTALDLFSKLARPVNAASGGGATVGNGLPSCSLAPHEAATAAVLLGGVEVYSSVSTSLAPCTSQQVPAAATASAPYPSHALISATAHKVSGFRSPQLSSAAFSHTATDGAGTGAANVVLNDASGLGNLTQT